MTIQALAIFLASLGFLYFILGISILSLFFGIDLSPYLLPFIILLMGGGFNVYSVLIDNLLTIHRKQHYLLVVTVLTFLFSKLIMVNLISKYEIAGAAIGFTLTMFVYFLLSVVTYVIIRKFVTDKLKNLHFCENSKNVVY